MMPLYHFEKKIPDDGNLGFLIDFIHVLDTKTVETIIFNTIGEKYLNISQYLRFHPLMVVINNTGGLENNFYLYRPYPQANYSVITHDFDAAFSLSTEMAADSGNQIIDRLLENDSCRKLYHDNMIYIE